MGKGESKVKLSKTEEGKSETTVDKEERKPRYQLYQPVFDAVSIQLTVQGYGLPFNREYVGNLSIELVGKEEPAEKLMKETFESSKCYKSITKIINKDWDHSQLVICLSRLTITKDKNWKSENSTVELETFVGIKTFESHNTSMTIKEESRAPMNQNNKEKVIQFTITIEHMPFNVHCPDTDSLCQKELNFVTVRTQHVFEKMNENLGESFRLTSPEDVPNIAIIGSGGGIRAVIGMSGAMMGLQKENILDYAMYTAGLSGSAWYFLSLYASGVKFNQLEQVNTKICQSLNNFHGNKFQMTKDILKYYLRRFVGPNSRNFSIANAFGVMIGNILLEKIPEWSLVLFDIDGAISKVRSTQLATAPRKGAKVDLSFGYISFKGEVLEVAETEKELDKFKKKWKTTPRAISISQEFARRKQIQQEDGFLNVWPEKKIPKWSLVLYDINGKTETVLSTTLFPAPKKSVKVALVVGAESLLVEVLDVAETTEELDNSKKKWLETPRAIGINTEIDKRKEKPRQDYSFLNDWSPKDVDGTWSLVLYDIDGKTDKVRSETLTLAKESYKTDLKVDTKSMKVEVLKIAETENEIDQFEQVWKKSSRAVAINREVDRRQRKEIQKHGYLNVEMVLKWSLILFDIDGKTDIVNSAELSSASKKGVKVALVIGTKAYKVEVLEVAETKNDLDEFEKKWKNTDRAIAILREVEERKKQDQQKHGFLNVEIVPVFSFVLFDINGKTKIVESIELSSVPKKNMTVNWVNDTESQRVEVLEVAETKKELETKTDEWMKTSRAHAIEKEITSRQNMVQRENGFLNVWPKEKNYIYYFSDLEDEMDKGVVPLPLVAALHIRDGKTSNDHHEWIEFSPYEVFMPRYGVAIDMKDFGKKFNAGYVIEEHGEKPIHFLLGLCGSAYTILRNYTLQGTLGSVITIVQKLRPQGFDKNISWRYFSYYFGFFLYLFDYVFVGSVPNFLHGMTRFEILPGSKVVESSNSKFETLLREVGKSFFISCVILIGNEPFFKHPDGSWYKIWSLFGTSILTFFGKFVGNLLNMLLDISGNEPFYEYPEAGSIDISAKKMMLVDAGIAFNSPYPAVLRPGREIDIIISFDFSDRGKDTELPFEELEKAAKWAKERCIPFPNITEQLKHIEKDWKEGTYKQLYVFKGDKDEPTIIHFVMNGYNVNVEDHFDILPEYSTLRFDYSENEFKKLNSLVENQVTSNVDEIKQCIRDAVDRKKNEVRNGSTKCSR